MAEGITREIQIVDLQIDILQKKKRLLTLQCQRSEQDRLSSYSACAPNFQVSGMTSFGQVRLETMGTAHAELGDAGLVTDAFQQDPQIQAQDNKVVVIQARRHAGTFKFETRDDWIQKLMDEPSDVHDEMWRRKCLSKCLRQNCGPVVKSIPVKDGLFQDKLIAAGCLDEEDWNLVMGTRQREDNQMRAIIVIVLKKDLHTILDFLYFIREINRGLVDKIMNSYKQLADDGFGEEKSCWLCLVEDRVKFSIFVDKLFGEEMIDAELYMETSKEDMDVEKRKNVWNDIMKSLQKYSDDQKVVACLQEAIQASGVHTDICKVISETLNNHGCPLQCSCGPQMILLKPNEYEKKTDGDSGLECHFDSSTKDPSYQTS